MKYLLLLLLFIAGCATVQPPTFETAAASLKCIEPCQACAKCAQAAVETMSVTPAPTCPATSPTH